jgi:chemotaxis protein CheX
MSPAEVEMNGYEVIKDAIGEITNMTAGGFKNRLCDIGFPCKLTLPTIVRGKDLSVDGFKGTERHIFQFECAGHILLADIQFKAE